MVIVLNETIKIEVKVLETGKHSNRSLRAKALEVDRKINQRLNSVREKRRAPHQHPEKDLAIVPEMTKKVSPENPDRALIHAVEISRQDLDERNLKDLVIMIKEEVSPRAREKILINRLVRERRVIHLISHALEPIVLSARAKGSSRKKKKVLKEGAQSVSAHSTKTQRPTGA